MADAHTSQLSDVLEQLERSVHGETVTVGEVVDQLGHKSFAALMLLFSLIAVSPASAIPGITTVVAVIVFILVIQMIVGRTSLWLPGFILRRRMAKAKLCKGIAWLRRPVHFVERFIKPRLPALLHRPLVLLPLVLVLLLTLGMPFLEVIPTTGSIASAVIALVAAGLLTRDGAFVLAGLLILLGLPVAIWHFGFAS